MKSVRFWAAAAVGAACILGDAAQAAPSPGPAPEPTKPVDPRRYIGLWFEIARLPNKLQVDCQAPTADWIKQGDGSLRSCRPAARARQPAR